jgi:hypothetical protein
MLSAATSHADSDTSRTIKALRMIEVKRLISSHAKASLAAGRRQHHHPRQRHQQREHRRRGVADQYAHEQPKRCRPAHGERCHLDPRADCRACGECDPGTRQDHPKLQIEPGRPDFGADRTRGGEQKFGDLVEVHRQNLIARQIIELDSNIRQIPIMAVPAPSIRHAAGAS